MRMEPLSDLCRRAAGKRDAAWGSVVTYSRKVFIPLTNLCRDTCGYCVFAQPPTSPSARYLRPDEVLDIARAGQRLGCKEALFSLGEKPEVRYREAREALARLGYASTIEYLRDMCALVIRETGLLPHANPGTLSDDEIRLLRPGTASMGMMLETVSRRLMQKGQAHHACPDKEPDMRLATLERAGQLNIPFTTGILIGIGETWEERIDSLNAIRDIHRRHGHIQEVIIQNFRAKPGIRMATCAEPDFDDMMRTLAAARLILDPDISLQAPPNLQSERFAEYIGAGLNDWGGVSPLTPDHINPERAWPEIARLREATESMGCELRERLTIYPKYLAEAERFVAPEMIRAVDAQAGADRLAAVQCPA